ncbi:MAG TPA: DUF1819 family protein [Anaerolineae bacterium]|nr:DUF1819 family protein [Anaerolineae bacterium]
MYTSTLNSGLGMIDETKLLINLWQPGMSSSELQAVALSSGYFPNISARRLRNLISEYFVPCYLQDDGEPAILLRNLQVTLTKKEFEQLLFIFTCRIHTVLADFIRELYWPSYAAGWDTISNEEAYKFVIRDVEDGKTTTTWSENTARRVARYLTGYCADFGLLEKGQTSTKRIVPYRLEQRVAAILVYDLRFAGHGDNSIVAHPDWALFGLEPPDVIDELKRLALKDWLIVQAAGSVIRIGWKYQNMEEVIDALTRGEL